MHITTAAGLARLKGLLRAADGSTGFAVLRRNAIPAAEVMIGPAREFSMLADVPLHGGPDAPLPVLILIPFRQITERGLACIDDGAPIRCIFAEQYLTVPQELLAKEIPYVSYPIDELSFSPSDADYEAVVRSVISDEIGAGEGSNFVIRRDLCGRVRLPSPSMLAGYTYNVFRHLLDSGSGSYWRYLLSFPNLTFVGATPERHLTLEGGYAGMTPMSGTHRYSASQDALPELLDFLRDRKEIEELWMVVDEELKMMTKACRSGVLLTGPYLRLMDHLAHTEYRLSGSTEIDVMSLLRSSMFAPTVTGSPLENAFRVIARHESAGRGYYSGIVGLISADRGRTHKLDSAIVIRTVSLDPAGRFVLSVGSTLVRDSVPGKEVLETKAKAAGLVAALGVAADSHDPPAVPGRAAALRGRATTRKISRALRDRNAPLARFWFGENARALPPNLHNRRGIIVNMEDDWTHALVYILRHLGLDVTEAAWRDVIRDSGTGGMFDPDRFHVLIGGPGPGDPRDMHKERVYAMAQLLRRRLAARAPLFAVCLSHQILSQIYGFAISRLAKPQQGVMRQVAIAGREVRVGFYNSFAAMQPRPALSPEGTDVWFDPRSREIHGFRSSAVLSLQFHAESVLSMDGVNLVRDLLADLLQTG